MTRRLWTISILAGISGLFSLTADAAVRVWEQEEVIPTYVAGAPEKNPMFYFGRASQGAEGRVYPYPLFDTLTGRKEDKTYRLVYLENEYLKIGIAPEIGGRIFSGLDKTNNYNFFYKQSVIKPALIGLIGAWISGGVEWNIPHHHRASTFMPVQYRIEEEADGSKTVWVGELEVRHRMRWAVGYTLHPGKSYLEISVRIVNRTPVEQTMLCFANAAVHTNEQYQVIFPPSTQFGTHHGKRQFTTWPIATGRYGGGDFSEGVDISWYKNHLSANSVFAWNYQDDFLAGYDHGKQAGTMSIANHHIVPGKKFWTWGNGPRGRMWDKILTDDDGPYIELMVGSYSDNQPDYSWLAPYETRAFKNYWYPFRGIGGVKNANRQAAVNLEIEGSVAKVGFCTTEAYEAGHVVVALGDKIVLDEVVTIGPAQPYTHEITLPEGAREEEIRASLSVAGKTLVAYTPEPRPDLPMPPAVTDPAEPNAIATTEELYLTGLRIQQFHSPSLEPEPYWREALRRDPGDTRVNTALGIKAFRQGRYDQAEAYLRTALKRLTDRYTSPKEGEARYYLGAVLKAKGEPDAAYDVFYQATWNAAWRGAGYDGLAEIDCLRGDMVSALKHVERALEVDALNSRALNLKVAILRHLDRDAEALAVLAAAQEADPLDVRSLAERWLIERDSDSAQRLGQTMNAHPATAMETAAEYLNAGLWRDGREALMQMIKTAPARRTMRPMVYYYLAYFADRLGEPDEVKDYCRLARRMSPDYEFPFQAEAMTVLERAMQIDPTDARAPYYLGNLLYDWQPDRATHLWELSARLDAGFPIVHRNLALAYARQPTEDALERAIAAFERAVSQEDNYAIHFTELDELYEAAGRPPAQRLALLEGHRDTVLLRDDATARLVTLLVQQDRDDEAIDLMTGRAFEVWEGGRLDVAGDWVDAHLLRGRRHLRARQFAAALADFSSAQTLPENLPLERGGGVRSSEIDYWRGVTHAAMNEADEARTCWDRAAAEGDAADPSRRRRPARGDAGDYYRALALQKLDRETEARRQFAAMIEEGERRLTRQLGIEGVLSPDERRDRRRRRADAHCLVGLGHLGLGDRQAAGRALDNAIEVCPDHLEARVARDRMSL